MLIRLFLHVTLLVLTAFTAAILLIHAQPVDDSDLRALLNPANCTAPCFLGIRPGVTTAGEAIALLQHHAWVASVMPQYSSGSTAEDNPSWVAWDWKDDAPTWFYTASEAILGHAGIFETLDGIVENITVATNIPFGSIRLTLGLPPGYGLSFATVNITRGVFSSVGLRYRDHRVENNVRMDAASLCSAVERLWFKPSSITFFDTRQTAAMTLDNQPLLDEINMLKRNFCAGRS